MRNKRRAVVNLPQRGYHRSGTGQKERFGKVRDAFLSLEGPTAVSHAERTTRSASKRSWTISDACRNPSSPADAVAQQHQSRSIWKCGICKPVNSEVDDTIFRYLRRLECGLSCRGPQQQLAFLS